MDWPDIDEDFLDDIDEHEWDEGYELGASATAKGISGQAQGPPNFELFLEEIQRPAWQMSEETVCFLQNDIDNYLGRNAEGQQVPIIRMFGVTAEGHSVVAHVHGFFPYFFVGCPSSFSDFNGLVKALNQQVRTNTSGQFQQEMLVLRIEPAEDRLDFMFYSEQKVRLAKVILSKPFYMRSVYRALEAGIFLGSGAHFQGRTYEAKLSYPLRFMLDTNLTGGCWLTCGQKKTLKCREASQRLSRCQIEFDVSYEDICAHPAEGEYLKLAPFRVCSFDIECCALAGKGFPLATKDPVIQIGVVCQTLGQKDPDLKAVWTLNTCDSIPGAQVFAFQSEEKLLLCFSRFLQAYDPDLLTGYNIISFDIPYLMDRAKALKCEEAFARFGRIPSNPVTVKDAQFSSKQMGKRDTKNITTGGIVVFDMLPLMLREYKLRSYTLNAVSREFLGSQKDDVHYSIIPVLQKGNAETRRRLAEYCLKDAWLPLQLMEKLLCLYNYVEMARVTGTPLSFLLTRGQQIKVLFQIYRSARKLEFAVPTHREAPAGVFEGATVLEPNCGYYAEPVATLDFASLYPSIMQAHNLCYTTMVEPELYQRWKANWAEAPLKPEDITVTPIGFYFVKAHIRKGVLPIILGDLLGSRKQAKKEMNLATDTFIQMVLNGRQMALKVSANSVYGFTGAQVGDLPALEISSSVTSFGREMIEQTKSQCEQIFTKENGYAHDCQVIYGDTDSVFVQFGGTSVKESMELGEFAADVISKTFPEPIKLEFEKVYHPLLLMNKKRYAGLLFAGSPDKHDKMDKKGIESVRRDNCKLVGQVIDKVLDLILIHKSPESAVTYVQETLSDLLQGKIDLSLLVISKSLSKGVNKEDYLVTAAHVEVAQKLRKRNPDTAPGVGDRVPYVILRGVKGEKVADRAEDPLYVLENKLVVDGTYYVDQQLKLPLLRLFNTFLKDAENRLFHGPHMLKLAPSQGAPSGMSAFFVKGKKCFGCGTTMKANVSGQFCQHCGLDKQQSVFLGKIKELKREEALYNAYWAECQRCQGSMRQEILCQNCDCPQFYKREKVKISMSRLQEDVNACYYE